MKKGIKDLVAEDGIALLKTLPLPCRIDIENAMGDGYSIGAIHHLVVAFQNNGMIRHTGEQFETTFAGRQLIERYEPEDFFGAAQYRGET